jgi:hypothetical protein
MAGIKGMKRKMFGPLQAPRIEPAVPVCQCGHSFLAHDITWTDSCCVTECQCPLFIAAPGCTEPALPFEPD